VTGTPVRIGLLRLSDSAPVLLAQAEGLFARAGIDAEIAVEPSWANIADKLAYGLLDAAVMLPPLALAAAAGLRGIPARLVVPMGLTLGGNSIAVTQAVARACAGATGALALGHAFLAWARTQEKPPRVAVVHAFSTHNLLLRHWLAAAGGDPEREVEIVAIPPEQVVAALAAGRVAGFCAGAPWGDAAVASGAGTVLLGTSDIWAHHPEKCFALAGSWAETQPDAATRLLRALLQAGRLCDTPAAAPRVAAALAGIGLDAATVRAALPGGGGREIIGFHHGAAWFPWRSQARWFLAAMQHWGWLPAGTDHAALAARVYRPDLLHPAASAENLSWPQADSKPEGTHTTPWQVPATPAPLQLLADRLIRSGNAA
jgi:two-component system, oxyanion-binding sensor